MEKQDQNKKHNDIKSQKKPLTPLWLLIYGAIGLLFISGLVMVIRQYILLPDINYVQPTPTPIQNTPANTPIKETPAASNPQNTISLTATPEPTPVNVPTKIYFSRQKQSCPIVPVGRAEGNDMGSVDDATTAGWFYYGASPGDEGTAIINGHQRFGGKAGTFSVLKKMQAGDEVVIEFEDGSLKYFEAEKRETYLEEEVPIEYLTVGKNTPTRLILITCLGDYGPGGLSQSRVVVIFNEVKK